MTSSPTYHRPHPSQHLWRGRTLTVAAVAVLLAAGCSVAGPPGAGYASPGAPTTVTTDPSPSKAATPSSSPSASPTPSTSASPTGSTAPADLERCPLDDLRVRVRAAEGGAAAGSRFLLLTFSNTGDDACALEGYPGVSFVGGDGTQLGEPAVRNRDAERTTVRLAAGRSTTALLQVAQAGTYDEDTCRPTEADGFRVYPPGSRTSAFVRYRVEACRGDVGSSPQLVVSPVGTGG